MNGDVKAIAVNSTTGDLYVGGAFTTAGGVSAHYIAKWDGSTWSALGSGVNANVEAVAVNSSTGEVYAGGAFTTAGGITAHHIAKWNGSAWSALGSGMNDFVYAVAVNSSTGNVYAGGHFTTAGGVSANFIAKWNGSVWSALGSGMRGYGSSYGDVFALAVNSTTGDVYAGGIFTTAGGVSANYIARWHGSSWSALGSGMNTFSSVDAIAVNNTTGEVYAGGAFTTAGGVSAHYIAQWNGSAWSAMGGGPSNGMNGGVDALAVNSSTGNVYAGGIFTTAGGVSANYIAKWNGSAWSALGSGLNGGVSAVAVNSATGDVPVGGVFTTAGGKVSDYFGMWHIPAPLACTIQFSDVPVGSTFYPYIHCLACLGIVSGYPDGTYRPGNPETRAQLAKIVSNSAGFNDIQTTQLFQDVPTSATFFQFIGRLASRGFIGGYPCGGANEPCVPPANLPYFRPNRNTGRGQISKIDANAAGFSETPSGQQFQDVPIGSTYYTYTYRLVTRNIMSGHPCGGQGEPCVPPANLPYFFPNANATRGQTAKFVSNTFFPNCQTP